MRTEQISVFSRRRMVWAGVMALLAVALFLASPGTSSATGSYCETTFYSDAAHTTIVGERIKTCSGSVFTWGTTSVYKVTACEPCG